MESKGVADGLIHQEAVFAQLLHLQEVPYSSFLFHVILMVCQKQEAFNPNLLKHKS